MSNSLTRDQLLRAACLADSARWEPRSNCALMRLCRLQTGDASAAGYQQHALLVGFSDEEISGIMAGWDNADLEPRSNEPGYALGRELAHAVMRRDGRSVPA